MPSAKCAWLNCREEVQEAGTLCPAHAAEQEKAKDTPQEADALRLADGLPVSRCDVRDGVLYCY